MASEYDGSIKLGVGFDAKDVRESAKELKETMEQALNSMDGKELNKTMESMKQSMKKAVKEATELEHKLSELEDKRIPTDEYKEISDQIDKANKTFNDLLYKQQEMQRMGKDHGRQWDALSDRMDEVGNEIRYAQGELQDLVDTGKAFKLGSETDEFSKLTSQLDNTNSKMRVLSARHDEYNQKQAKTNKGVQALSIAFGTLGKDIKNLLNKLKQLTTQLLKAASGTIVRGFKKLGSSIVGLGKQATTSDINFKKLFRTLLKYGIGVRSFFVLFRKVRSAVTEGIQEMAQMNNGLNPLAVTMNEFQTSLQYLRNSLAVAFAPIVTTVLPILTAFIDRVAQAVQSVGAFFSALKGASTFTNAIRTPYKSKEQNKAEKADITAQNKANKAAAKEDLKQRRAEYKKQVAEQKAAMKERNKEIKEAESANKQIGKNNAKVARNTALKNLNTKATIANTNALKKQKGELAGFDDLDVLGQEEDTGALQNFVDVPPELADAIGEFNDALAETPELVQDVAESFKEAEIPDWIKNLAEKIKEFIANNDWYGLGEFLGEKFNGLLMVVDDWINNVLRPEGVKWAGRIAELLNGLVAGIDWALLGKTIADGINAAFDIVNTFLTTFDFLAFGQALGTAIKSWFDNIDWALVGQTFANKWNAFIHTIQGIVTTPGIWTSIGTSIGTFLQNAIATLDIDGLATTFIALFNGIFEMVRAFLDTFPFQGLAQKIYNGLNRMIHEIDWAAAGKTLSDLVVQLLDVFMRVAEETDWVAFGEGIGNFLSSIDWAGILGRVASIVWQVASGILAGFFSTDSGKAFLAIVAGIEGLKIAFALGSNLLLPAVKKILIDKLAQILITEGVGGIFPAMASAVVSGLSGILSFITGIGPMIVGAVSSILSTIVTAVSGFIAFLFTPQGLIIAAIAAVLTLLIVLIVNNWDSVKEIGGNIMSGLGDFFKNVGVALQGAMDGIASIFKTAINFYLSLWENFLNGIVGIVNLIISAINLLHITVPDWVPLLGGQTIGFNIPTIPKVSIPKLAQGAVIPPNKEFLAMLGDQNSGTNIEAPLDTIVDAFREVVGNMQVQNTGYSEMTLDGQTFARLATPYIISELERKGYNVTVLEA